MINIGKCPSCDSDLEVNDVEMTIVSKTANYIYETRPRKGKFWQVSYKCKKCDHIIGFGSR